MGHPGDPGAGGWGGGQQHSRVHIREEAQLAGEDLGQQHPHKGPAQGTETQLQVLWEEKAPAGGGRVRGAQTDACSNPPEALLIALSWLSDPLWVPALPHGHIAWPGAVTGTAAMAPARARLSPACASV